MTRGHSDSVDVVNPARAVSDAENVDLEDWCFEVSGEEILVPEDLVLRLQDVRLTLVIRVALEWLDAVKSVWWVLQKGISDGICDCQERKQLVSSKSGQNSGDDEFWCSHDFWCTTFPGVATSTRISWPSDSTISRLASGYRSCMLRGSAMRKLQKRYAGSAGARPIRIRCRDGPHDPFTLVLMGDLSRAERHVPEIQFIGASPGPSVMTTENHLLCLLTDLLVKAMTSWFDQWRSPVGSALQNPSGGVQEIVAGNGGWLHVSCMSHLSSKTVKSSTALSSTSWRSGLGQNASPTLFRHWLSRIHSAPSWPWIG